MFDKNKMDLKEDNELPKGNKEVKPKEDGMFSLTKEEMALAMNALANSEEFKLYQRVLIGGKIASMINEYQAKLSKNEQN